MNEQLMTVAEFAKALGVTNACIRRWIWERRVASVKLGRCVRLPATEVARIVEAGLRPAKPRPGRGNR
jgi:excisionase family DNA binding protein